MIKNNYLFSSQFLNYLKTQKISDEESFEGFVKTVKTITESAKSKSEISDSNYINIISYLQFANPNKLEIFNTKRVTKYSYLYERFPLKKKVSCIYILSNVDGIDSTIKGYYPVFDLIQLLKREKLEWGILTDGKTWRLYSTLSSLPYENYVEIDFSNDSEDNYKVFWQLFTLHLFIPDEYDVTPLEKYIDESEKEAKVIEAHIKDNIDEILENICFGFLSYAGKDKKPLSEEEKELYFENAVYLLFRMLFILYAESRELLPIDRSEYQEFSFNGLLDKVKSWLANGIPAPAATDLWDAFRDLSLHIEYGENKIGIPEYDGGLFDTKEKPFLTDPKNKLTNEYFVKVLSKLGYFSKKKTDIKIEYRDLSVRSIGSLYEGILEYKLFIADTDTIIRGKKIISKSSAGTVKKTDREIPKGHVYFSQDAFERHDTGSYYTPEDVVNYMVQNSVRLGLEERWIDFLPTIKKYENEIVKAVNDDIKNGLLNKLDREVLQFVEDKILTFKVMDPAMGSGHFSVNSLNAITHFVIEVLQKSVIISDGPIKHEKEIINITWDLFKNEDSKIDLNPADWRRRIVEKCIFGIDINPLATELAKLSLWIASASKGKPLTFLDHHLKCGDSIMGVRLEDIMVYPSNAKNEKQQNLWEHFDKSKIEEIGNKIKHILSIDSDKVDNVYEKKEEYKQIEKEPYLNNLKDVATLWLMINFEIQKNNGVPLYLPDESKYYEFLDGASKYVSTEKWKTFIGFSLKELVDDFTKRKNVFHWELEFIELITNGLDSIIGNPPFVDVSELNYIGLNLSVINSRNLYSYILSKCEVICADNGFCSFILPMSIINTERMISLRSQIINSELFLFNIDSAHRPGILFENVRLQLTILTLKKNYRKKTYTTSYSRFYSAARKLLFQNVSYIENSFSSYKVIPKLGSKIEINILNKIYNKTEKTLAFYLDQNSDNIVYYKNAGVNYYTMAYTEPPLIKGDNGVYMASTVSELRFSKGIKKDVVASFIYSSLFYWFWILYGDCFHLTRTDICRIHIDIMELQAIYTDSELWEQIKENLTSTSKIVTYRRRHGENTYPELKPRYSKHLLNKIDHELARYYGFTKEELDYIINYDIKYRID